MWFRDKIMDPNPKRRRGTRDRRQSLLETSHGEVKKLATRASVPHPQGARHMHLCHRQKCSHTTHR
jgi:hypothetical protein